MIPTTLTGLQPILQTSVDYFQEMLQNEIALPLGVGLITVFLTIMLFYNISESMKRSGGQKGESDAVRRSTRCVSVKISLLR
jgi:hypothetical protein